MIASLKSAAAAFALLVCCSIPFWNVTSNSSSSFIPVEQDDHILINMIDSSPIVIESHKLIFFPVPKVADTLWLMLLRRMMGLENWKSIDDDSFDGLVRLSDYSPEQAAAMMNSPEYTRATFVRDPKDRFLSTFLDKVMSGDASIKQSCCPQGQNCLHKYQTMSDFVSLIQTCDDKHWIPMSTWIDRKVIPTLNFVGHLETAEADARSLLERIGAWEAFGSSGWGAHGNEAIFATKDELTDVTSSELSGSWDLLSKLMTPRIESTLELFYEEDYSIREFGLALNKIPFPAEMPSSLQSKKMFSNEQPFNKVHIIMFETTTTEQYEENSSLGFFLQTSERVGIETTTFGAGTSFKGWGDKYLHIRDTLKAMSDDTLVVVSDSRDVLLNVPDRESAASIVSHFISSYQRMTINRPDAVVMSAEPQCCVSAMSQAGPLDYFDPITGKRKERACTSGKDTCQYEDGFYINAWKTFMSELSYHRTGEYQASAYLNAGVFAGSARNILHLLDRVDIGETEDDQAVMSGLLYHDPEALVLDYENELFGVAEWPKGLEAGCVFFEDSKSVLIHSVTKASPMMIHTPGKFYGCLDLLIEKVGGVSQKRYLGRALKAANYKPTRKPTRRPTRRPTRKPTRRPTRNPTRAPTKRPTNNPAITPTRSPTRRPTPKPTKKRKKL